MVRWHIVTFKYLTQGKLTSQIRIRKAVWKWLERNSNEWVTFLSILETLTGFGRRITHQKAACRWLPYTSVIKWQNRNISGLRIPDLDGGKSSRTNNFCNQNCYPRQVAAEQYRNPQPGLRFGSKRLQTPSIAKPSIPSFVTVVKTSLASESRWLLADSVLVSHQIVQRFLLHKKSTVFQSSNVQRSTFKLDCLNEGITSWRRDRYDRAIKKDLDNIGTWSMFTFEPFRVWWGISEGESRSAFIKLFIEHSLRDPVMLQVH